VIVWVIVLLVVVSGVWCLVSVCFALACARWFRFLRGRE